MHESSMRATTAAGLIGWPVQARDYHCMLLPQNASALQAFLTACVSQVSLRSTDNRHASLLLRSTKVGFDNPAADEQVCFVVALWSMRSVKESIESILAMHVALVFWEAFRS